MMFALAGYGAPICATRNRAGSAFRLRKSNMRAEGKISSVLENPMKPYENEIRSNATTAHATTENIGGRKPPPVLRSHITADMSPPSKTNRYCRELFWFRQAGS